MPSRNHVDLQDGSAKQYGQALRPRTMPRFREQKHEATQQGFPRQAAEILSLALHRSLLGAGTKVVGPGLHRLTTK